MKLCWKYLKSACGRIRCGREDSMKMNRRRKRVCGCGLGGDALAYF